MSDPTEQPEERPRIAVLARGGILFESSRGRKAVPLTIVEMRVLGRLLQAQARVLENRAPGTVDMELVDE